MTISFPSGWGRLQILLVASCYGNWITSYCTHMHNKLVFCFVFFMDPQALREELQRQRGSSVGSGGTVEDAERIKSLEDELER